jgi:uncharacterized OB-fold protein
MLLLVKGQPTKARCCECSRLYVPPKAEVEANAKRQNAAFMCKDCRDVITERFRPLNRRAI